MIKILLRVVTATAAIALSLGGYLYATDFRSIIYLAAEQSVGDVVASTQPDGDDFRLLFCGTGSPNRTPDRGQPCAALVADGKLFLFDAGEGSMAKLSEYGAPTGQLQAIFLTHLHSDHISGVAEVLHNTWLYGRDHPVATIGPPGTLEVVEGFATAYSQDLEERMRVLGLENLEKNRVFQGAVDVLVEGSDAKTVYEENGLVIRAFLVDHPDWPHAYGYRIEYRNKVVVISGDTAPSEGILRHAQGANILIHEALNSEIFLYIGHEMERQGGPMSSERMQAIAAVHTDTLELAEIARKTGTENLIITHLIPAMPANWISDIFFTAGMSDIFSGNIVIARDGQWIEVGKL